jgi:hypothetical protein
MATRNKQRRLFYSHSLMLTVMVLILDSPVNQIALYLRKNVRLLGVIHSEDRLV